MADKSIKITDKDLNLGQTNVTCRIYETDGEAKKAGIFFINVHDDENYAVEATKKVLETHGGKFIEIVHEKGTRYIDFNLQEYEQTFKMDPNRIYTDKGRKIDEGEENYGDNTLAKEAVKKFTSLILKELKNAKVIVAVHNNLGLLMEDCLPSKDMYDSGKDQSDFFFVTEKEYFKKLAEQNFNVVLQDNEELQDNETVYDDGSLSVYCGKNTIPYINVEVKSIDREEAKAISKQKKMIEAALDIVYKLNP